MSNGRCPDLDQENDHEEELPAMNRTGDEECSNLL